MYRSFASLRMTTVSFRFVVILSPAKDLFELNLYNVLAILPLFEKNDKYPRVRSALRGMNSHQAVSCGGVL